MKTSVITLQGVEAGTFEETLKASNLNWTPEADKVGGMDTGIEMPRKKLLYRSDTRQALGIVGTDYEPSDPKEFLQAQFEFANFVKGRVARAGFIPDRSRAFAFVEMGDKLVVPVKHRKVGDPHKVYIYSTDGWDGGTPRRARLYIERIRCTNGMTSREIKAALWVSHTKQMDERYERRWKMFLAEIRTTVDAVRNEFTQLAKTRMTEQEMKTFLGELIPGESDRSEKRRT